MVKAFDWEDWCFSDIKSNRKKLKEFCQKLAHDVYCYYRFFRVVSADYHPSHKEYQNGIKKAEKLFAKENGLPPLRTMRDFKRLWVKHGGDKASFYITEGRSLSMILSASVRLSRYV